LTLFAGLQLVGCATVIKQVHVQPRTLAVNVTLLVFASEHRAAARASAAWLPVFKLLLRCCNGTDRWTDTVPLH